MKTFNILVYFFIIAICIHTNASYINITDMLNKAQALEAEAKLYKNVDDFFGAGTTYKGAAEYYELGNNIPKSKELYFIAGEEFEKAGKENQIVGRKRGAMELYYYSMECYEKADRFDKSHQVRNIADEISPLIHHRFPQS